MANQFIEEVIFLFGMIDSSRHEGVAQVLDESSMLRVRLRVYGAVQVMVSTQPEFLLFVSKPVVVFGEAAAATDAFP